jgi:transposase InsO family protein
VASPSRSSPRELQVETHRLAAWRDDFLEGGKEALKAQRPDRSGDERALRQAERKVGQLTMENEILRAAAENRGVQIPPATGLRSYGAQPSPGGGVASLARPARRYTPAAGARVPARPGPATSTGDHDLLQLIRRVLHTSPFAGEGYRKVRARLRREHDVEVSGKRVLRLLRQEGLLAPQRVRGRRKPRPNDGTIILAAPNLRWGTDATMAWTRADGWVWVFACVDHYTAEAWAHRGPGPGHRHPGS